MDKTERYPWTYKKSISYPDKAYIYCARERCPNDIELFAEKDEQGNVITFKYPYDAVIVSVEDGDKRHGFCSSKCATSWLTSYKVMTQIIMSCNINGCTNNVTFEYVPPEINYPHSPDIPDYWEPLSGCSETHLDTLYNNFEADTFKRASRVAELWRSVRLRIITDNYVCIVLVMGQQCLSLANTICNRLYGYIISVWME